MRDDTSRSAAGSALPVRPQRIELDLAGLSVCALPSDRDVVATASTLRMAGIEVRMDSRGVVFPVRQLPLLVHLPRQVELVPKGELRTLVYLLKNSPDQGLPVVVSLDAHDTLNLSWVHAGRELNEPLSLGMAPALTSLEVPLVATDGTWDSLSAASRTPLVVARAHVNLDGFIELRATAPGRLEGSPLPGMFRIDDTRFGMPEKFADRVSEAPGVVWDGPLPAYDAPPSSSPDIGLALSGHSAADLMGLVRDLGRWRSQAVIWKSGLGRRTFCAAAVETLGAYPLLVVTHPAGMWAWQRQFELIGRPSSLLDPQSEVHLVTYHDLARRSQLPAPAAIIFDDLDVACSRHPHVLEALHRLDGLAGTHRIAVGSKLPDDPDELIAFMSVLRPVEFQTSMPVVVRYPGQSVSRLHEHVECYVSRRESGQSLDAFRRSRVFVVENPEPMRREAERILHSGASGAERVDQLRRLIAEGCDTLVGPKIAQAVQFVREGVVRGDSVAVLARSETAARYLAMMLLPLRVPVVSDGLTTADVAVFVGETWPDVRRFDAVIVLEYPDSMGTLEESVGSAAAVEGPRQVTVLHLSDSLDDRLAVASCLRQENPELLTGSPEYLLGS